MKVLLYICVLNNKKKIMEKKEKKVVQIEIGDDVKKLTIEGVDKDEKVVMREEIDKDDLDSVTGGDYTTIQCPVYYQCPQHG